MERVHEGAALRRQGTTRADVLWPQTRGLGARQSAAVRQGRLPEGGILQLARVTSHILLRPQVSPSPALALALVLAVALFLDLGYGVALGLSAISLASI